MSGKARMIEAVAVAITVAALIGLPVVVWSYHHRVVHQKAEGMRVIELYASADEGVWLEDPLRAWNYFFKKPKPRPIQIKLGQPILLRLTSIDVHHSFSIPQLRIHPMDITPGRWTEKKLKPEEAGLYTIICYTVCGKKHSYMQTELQVLDNE